ncbi:phosphoglucosamine mutase [Pseudomonas syringae pv. actinidiae]|uniref:Phosphoglucosamine mutase n=6 Tax=Pseudomonas syringae group TaxID=136849 RepID=A0A2S3TFI0_9PSED|nr:MULTISPECIES: phosphoglucosamine mutase [Pseudomonas syringae group]EPN04098.1 phosphoglucosamine mutase [Pseudomonas syringae pv. actinidiae ICMP 19070]EPN64777.1 phosphoglucosamine mutase [Pseudomonas syringae pv. actinidiae ICMP 19079]EPN70898.1 phosphoglucosamine mutase [Pseudomonas syringae pv. actinidiae ICMP 19101]AKT32296.1 phosphoglucosamine mutase [Pseudomonas syringae pv. actinidiae ICMP 18884]AOE58636.1 phosphoglucosamine mutase [Pseudomonas syringae pv. actinidiae ICMP 18708]
MTTRKYFGTDGIRGRVGQFPITPEFMLKLGWAAGMAFRKMGACRILVGKDTRISGYMFESALEAGLSAAGADVLLLGPMPTPAIAYLTRTFHAEAGIVISASHNPHYDNGIKFFSGQGTKLPDEIEMMIEELLDAPMTVAESENLGKVSRINDAAGRYIEFCKSSVPTSTDFAGLKVVIDCAHGATYKVAPNVFRELGAQVVVLSAQPDGLNINKDCGSTHMEALQAAVVAEHADMGIGFDGDGDRVLMVDHTGTIVDGDELLYIIARDLHERGRLQGGVVGTLMSNLGLELALAEQNIPFVRANVGDRYVIAELLERNWQIGGENSGHIVCFQHATTGDAIIASLQVILALRRSGISLAEARLKLRKCPQILINVRFEGSSVDPVTHPSVQEACARVTEQMAGRGRVLLRKSGTEPLVRVMVEGEDETQVRAYAEELAKLVAEVCA